MMLHCVYIRVRARNTQASSHDHEAEACLRPTHLYLCAGQEDHSEERSDSFQIHAVIPAQLATLSYKQSSWHFRGCTTPNNAQGLLCGTRLRDAGPFGMKISAWTSPATGRAQDMY